MAKTTKKHMSQQDKQDWDELYGFVCHKVMGYDENQSLSKTQVLRLKGLLNNKYMANNSVADTANYSYKVVLNTFKYCYLDIQKGLSNNTFVDENHKFSYILKIVENNLNTIYMRMKEANKAKEKTEAINIDTVTHNGAGYQNKTKKTSEKLNDLW